MKQAVIYRRVSTSEQGKSGKGLEAQASALARFCAAEGFEAMADFEEVASGKLGLEGRTGLTAALAKAARLKCPVIVSKLDRLSRDVAFISGLMARGVPFICGGQVISDSLIGFFDVDSRSKALGDKLPSFECSLTLL